MLSQSEKDEIIEKRARGESISSIAQSLNISCSSAAFCIAESAQRIANAINFEKDAFLKRNQMTAPERLQRKVELMKKITDELLSRDFSQVPAEKLIDMLFRLEEKTAEAIKVTIGEMKTRDTIDELLSFSDVRQQLVVSEI
jgi:enoyl reductase-like protein